MFVLEHFDVVHDDLGIAEQERAESLAVLVEVLIDMSFIERLIRLGDAPCRFDSHHLDVLLLAVCSAAGNVLEPVEVIADNIHYRQQFLIGGDGSRPHQCGGCFMSHFVCHISVCF